MEEPATLHVADALEGANERAGTPGADLDDHHEGPAARDHVELESAKPHVPAQDPEAACEEQVGDRQLRPAADLGAVQRAGTP